MVTIAPFARRMVPFFAAFAALACGSEDTRPQSVPGGSGALGGSLGGGATSGSGGAAGAAASGGNAGAGGSAGSAGSASGGAAGSASGGSSGAGGAAGLCPPAGPYGSNVGDIAPDVTLHDCDGKPVQLHSLCSKKAAGVYTFAIWCPICKAHMDKGEPQALYAAHQKNDFDLFVVVTENATGGKATEAHCKSVRDGYNLKMPVLLDKSGALSSSLGMSVNSGALVLSRGARIELKESYGFDSLAKKVPELLAK